jgi:hypothetical protein
MKQNVSRKTEGFVVEAHDRPIVALSAPSMSRARKLCSQE